MLRTPELIRVSGIVDCRDGSVRPSQPILRTFIGRHEVFGMDLQQAGPLPRSLAVANHDITGISRRLGNQRDVAILSPCQRRRSTDLRADIFGSGSRLSETTAG